MEHKIEAGCRIQEMLKAGYRKKISWRDRDMLTLIGAGCGIVLNLIAGCGIKTTSDPFEIYQGGIGIRILKKLAWQDEAKTSGGMWDLKGLFWTL